MKNFTEIKNELKEKNLTKKALNLNIFGLTLAKALLTEVSIVLITMIPFAVGCSMFGFVPSIILIYVIAHMAFYFFYIKKAYQVDFLEHYNEVKMTLEALKEIKAEK